MPLYVYQGEHPRMLFGLAHGVNAENLSRDLPEGSTLVVEPGDSIRTDESYEHVELAEFEPVPEPEPEPATGEPAKTGRTRRAKTTEE